MSEKMQEKLLEYIDTLAAQLGVATEYVMTMLIRQKITEGTTYAIMNLIWFILSVAAVWLVYRFVKWSFGEDWDDIGIPFGVVSGFVLLACSVVSVMNFTGYLLVVLNPEYYAIQDILKAIK